MGLIDLLDAFDDLDARKRGYVTAEEVEKFYFSLFELPSNEEVVESAIEKCCGPGVKTVKKEEFIDVLEEIERRRAVENEAYWDFQALDYNGSNHICLSHALLLFREYHGDLFSLDTWNNFLSSREKSESDVYFDEIRSWLSDIPKECQPSTQREIVKEESRLERIQVESAYRDLQEADSLLDNKDLERQEEEERQEQIEHSVKRKLNKWQNRGLGAMLDDHDGMGLDGTLEDDMLSSALGKDLIKTSDVVGLLEAKYSLLQEKILMEVASKAASMESEKFELFNSLKKMISKTRKNRSEDQELSQILQRTLLPYTLLSILGDLPDADAGRKNEFDTQRTQCTAQGMTDTDIDHKLRDMYTQILKGEQTCELILAQLSQRLQAEREAILSNLHGEQSGKRGVSSTHILIKSYSSLLRQLHILRGENQMTSAALAVGLAERPQIYKSGMYDWDRDRSDELAQERLEARVGRQQVKKSKAKIDIDSLEKAGAVTLRLRLVEELEQLHFLEREAMVTFLQGNDSNTHKAAAARMTSYDRQRKIRNLRSQRQECVALSNFSLNQKLLEEATALYLEERRLELGSRVNMTDTAVAAIVLSDLQQRQEVEASRILQESITQNKRDLTKVVLAQIESRKDELYPNIAYVTLGGLEVPAGGEEFLVTLEAKYKAMKDQVFEFGLIELNCSGYKSLSKEEKQKELNRQRKEEKRLRGENQLEQLESLIGHRSQALPSLFRLIGTDKLFPQVTGVREESDISKSVNLLADLASRFEAEQEALLLWLQELVVKSVTSKAKNVQLARLAAEKFISRSENGHEAAFLATGLLERIGSIRSKDDEEKQLLLAEKRSNLRKRAVQSGESRRYPPEEKDSPMDGNIRELQSVLVRTLLRRHYHEREVMLTVLQDPGLDDLVEAAALMSSDQAIKRLKELKKKREGLNLDDKEDNEEQTYIFEEAGAIRAAGKMAKLGTDLNKTVLLPEACIHLLAELQDLQDVEIKQLFYQLENMNASEICERRDVEEKSRKNNYCDTVMKVLTKLDGESQDNLSQLVEQKYHNLLDVLVEESLSQQHGGHTAWNKMGEKQKSKLMTALSRNATALWDEGNSSIVSNWIHPKFELKPSLPYLTGVDRGGYSAAVASTDPGSNVKEDESCSRDKIAGTEIVGDLYKRYQAEHKFVKDYVTGLLDEVPSDDEKILLQNRILWEISQLTSAHDFTFAALITGIAERQTADMSGRLEHDDARYQLLARQILDGNLELPNNQGQNADKVEDLSQLQALVMKTLHHKHMDEWAVMKKLLSSQKFADLHKIVSVETMLQRDNRITQLHKQRDDMDLKEKTKQHGILEEAFVVRKVSIRQILERKQQSKEDTKETSVTEVDVQVKLMTELLNFQFAEAQNYLEGFTVEDLTDLKETMSALYTEIQQGHVNNVAAVAFTWKPSETNFDDNSLSEVEQAVDDKYDALKDQLLIQALINQMGEAEWNRLSELERQRLLMELKLKERRLRREGKYDEAAALLGDLKDTDENIRKVLGDARDEHERRLRERLERRKARLAQGMSEEECDELEAQEIAEEEEKDKQKRKNILLYLDQCSEQEKADLLRRLGELEDEKEREKQRQLALVRQRREERRLRQEGNVDMAAMLLGISEDQHNRSKLSKEEEKRRQQELARQRLEMIRQRRTLQGQNLVRGESILFGSDQSDDIMAEEGRVDDAVLGLLDVRHLRERNILIKLLDEGSEGESRDEARILTDDELKDKMEEIEELFDLWKDSDTRAQADGEKILFDAVGFSVEWKRRELELDGQLPSDEDVKVALLSQLQEAQEAEAAQTILLLTDVDGERASEILNSQQHLLNQLNLENVASVLLESSGIEIGGDKAGDDDLEDGEKTVVEALEKKYDAMRDKLLMEALMREMGEADWSRLSELERQKKLVELKLKEKRLRREGRYDEIALLLGSFAEDSDRLSDLMGQSEQDQKQKLQEKLALRKKLKEEREAQGQPVDDETLDELVEEEDKKIQRKNILENLDKNFEAEKAALLSALRNQPDEMMKEKRRQLELVKFQREQRRLKKQDKVDTAVMIFAQGEENDRMREKSLVSERERQRLLAKERLESLKRQREEKLKGKQNEGRNSDKESSDDMPPETITDESTYLQSSIMSGLEKLQENERKMLMDLISKMDTTRKDKTMSTASTTDLQEKVAGLQEKYQALQAKTFKIIDLQACGKPLLSVKNKNNRELEKCRAEQSFILERALAYKFELERRRLATLRPNMTPAQINNELSTCALTFLQEKQQTAQMNTQDKIKEQQVDDLKKHASSQSLANQAEVYPALADTCFNVCLTSDLADLMQDGDKDSSAELHDLEVMLADEYNTEKEEIQQRGQKESIDVSLALKKLEEQYKQRQQAINTDLAGQREELKKRVASKKEASEALAWNRAYSAGQIFADGAENNKSALQAKEAEMGRQENLLQQRIQAKRKAKEAKKAKQAEAEKLVRFAREDAASPPAGSPALNRRMSTMSMLSRERTVVDVSLTEDEKQAKYDQLFEQERVKREKMYAEESRQKKKLEERLGNRGNKRENQAAALFSIGERQKTVLQKSRQDERERQQAQVREKVTRMRESRSLSPTKRQPKSGKEQ